MTAAMRAGVRRRWLVVAGVVLLVGLGAFLAVRWALDPLLLKTVAESQLSAALGQPVRIGTVHLSFFPSPVVTGTGISVGAGARAGAWLDIRAIFSPLSFHASSGTGRGRLIVAAETRGKSRITPFAMATATVPVTLLSNQAIAMTGTATFSATRSDAFVHSIPATKIAPSTTTVPATLLHKPRPTRAAPPAWTRRPRRRDR